MKKTNICPTCGHKIGAADSPPCPKCGSRSVRAGKAKNRSQRYLCSNRSCRYIFGEGTLVNTLTIKKKKKEAPAPDPKPEEPIPPATGTEAPLPSQPPTVDQSTPSP